MSNKLYVGNIPFQTDEDALKDAFGAFGSVSSVKIIMDRETGRSKGFGFVEMETAEAAQAAIENLDGKDFNGRNLKVNEAREKEPRNNRRF
jgi:RNA recognition motif-containing protein